MADTLSHIGGTPSSVLGPNDVVFNTYSLTVAATCLIPATILLTMLVYLMMSMCTGRVLDQLSQDDEAGDGTVTSNLTEDGAETGDVEGTNFSLLFRRLHTLLMSNGMGLMLPDHGYTDDEGESDDDDDDGPTVHPLVPSSPESKEISLPEADIHNPSGEFLGKELATGGELRCPICLGIFRDACVTSCGHTFCANCILRCARPVSRKRSRSRSGSFSNEDGEGGCVEMAVCPIDRQPIHGIFKCFTVRNMVERAVEESTSSVYPRSDSACSVSGPRRRVVSHLGLGEDKDASGEDTVPKLPSGVDADTIEKAIAYYNNLFFKKVENNHAPSTDLPSSPHLLFALVFVVFMVLYTKSTSIIDSNDLNGEAVLICSAIMVGMLGACVIFGILTCVAIRHFLRGVSALIVVECPQNYVGSPHDEVVHLYV